ncbi:hypothetical protein E4T38_08315 [Aureobasidium subglaciale]|nr:hypothetical protein E4T38_08315 [Aureobasidium subglaciale]KAI5215585.1 hypothetical protein E4T40_08282 [Aureobasidium subglaciale]KAI5218813.1 hypothetical protein E4T41_08197 [Aureobasidium subglaciale]KAI5256484.1 hypothetical protein E4T46_08173 [Aureobasidium subglaciale]
MENSSSILEKLPTEIFLQISSVHYLASASKKIRNLTTTVSFRNVTLPIANHVSVDETVHRLVDDMARVDGLVCIRTLRLCQASHDIGIAEQASREIRSMPDCIMQPAEAVWSYNEAWKPVADLLRQLSALTDLLYELPHQVPPCILDILHQYQPQCRLHLRTFALRSLDQPELDKHELAIITSPNLHAIWSAYVQQDNGRAANNSQQVVQQIAGGLAPNLQEVCFIRKRHPLRSNDRRPIKSPESQEVRSLVEGCHLSPSTRLERLEIYPDAEECGVLTKEELVNWSRHVDFTHLQTLVMDLPAEMHAVQWLKDEGNTTSLKVLNFQPRIIDGGPWSVKEKALCRTFVHARHPLSELTIGGTYSLRDFGSITSHGVSLRKLIFKPTTEFGYMYRNMASTYKNLGRNCPNLTHLEAVVQRDFKGETTESDTYKVFGRCPNLRRLKINLITTIPYYMVSQERLEDFDDFDSEVFPGLDRYGQVRHGDVKQWFINKAIDEDFAKTVLRLTSPVQSNQILERLEIAPDTSTFEHVLDDTLIRGVVNHICRSWVAESAVGDDQTGQVTIQELGKEIRKSQPAPKELDPRVKQIFRRVWPGSNDGKSDWRTDWHSQLAIGEDDGQT